MFIAREVELSELSAAMSHSSHSALVYGKRRVGKTSLIKEALKGQEKTAVYYECIICTTYKRYKVRRAALPGRGISTALLEDPSELFRLHSRSPAAADRL